MPPGTRLEDHALRFAGSESYLEQPPDGDVAHDGHGADILCQLLFGRARAGQRRIREDDPTTLKQQPEGDKTRHALLGEGGLPTRDPGLPARCRPASAPSGRSWRS